MSMCWCPSTVPPHLAAARGLRAISVVAALAVVTVGCTGADPGGTARSASGGAGSISVLLPPEGLELRTVSLPDYSVMTDAVAQQIRAQETVVRARVADFSGEPAALGDAYGRLGMLFLAATHVEPAKACLLNAQTLKPDDVRWPYYLGRVYESTGDLEESTRAYERAVELEPNDLAILLLLGNVLLSQGSGDAAEEVFTHALEQYPSSAGAEFGLGRLALAAQDYAAATERLERALALNPQATSIHYSLALAYRGLGDAEKAEAHLNQRGDIEPRPPDPLRQQLDELLESANAYNIRGGRALDVGDFAAAADYFRRGLELDPSDPSLRQRLGIALFQLGDAPGAMEQFEEVVRVTPDHTQSQFSLGLLLAQEGRYEEAIERFSTTLEYDPDYVQARLQLADVQARLGRPAEALSNYDRVLEQNPTLPEAAFPAAMMLVRLGRYDRAHERLTEGLRAHPDDMLFKHALARILAAAPDDSVRDGERAMSLVEELLAEQQNVELGETAAMALAELGLYEQAVAVQRDVMAAARQAGFEDAVARMAGNLALYEQGRPCRTPFAAEELP